MGELRKISITLPSEMADAIRARVESGEYASESEVIREGLLALQDRDQSVEDWLREEAGEIHDAILADPERGLSSEEVKASLARDRATR
jgi:antitoxin ParD1/3/4